MKPQYAVNLQLLNRYFDGLQLNSYSAISSNNDISFARLLIDQSLFSAHSKAMLNNITRIFLIYKVSYTSEILLL